MHGPFDQRIFARECVSVAEHGYDTHYIVQLDQPTRLAQGVHLHSVDTVSQNDLRLRPMRRLRRFWRALRLAQELKAEVYHLHDPELIPLGMWLKLRTRAVVIFDSHEHNTAYIRQKQHLPAWIRWAIVLMMSGLERLASRSFDAIVTADQGTGTSWQGYGAKRVVVVRNFPRLEMFSANAVDGQEKRFDLVYHGTIPRYHLTVAFAVAEELKRLGVNARWLFFGSCPEAEWAFQELESRGLSDCFVLEPGRIPHEQAIQRVQQAKIGFIPLPKLPKFEYNIPSKLFEFMALGLPTILSDLPPSRTFVGDGKCAIMVPPADYKAYAQAIVRLLTDEGLYANMSRCGRERVREMYNWQTEAQRLFALYKEIT